MMCQISPNTYKMLLRMLMLFSVAALHFPLYGCSGGQESEEIPETLLPDRPEDKIVEGTNLAPEIDADPTPQAGTGGNIPGYDPAEVDQVEVPSE